MKYRCSDCSVITFGVGPNIHPICPSCNIAMVTDDSGTDIVADLKHVIRVIADILDYIEGERETEIIVGPLIEGADDE